MLVSGYFSPMLRLELDNQRLSIQGASLKTLRLLDKKTSYLVQGHRHTQAFKKGSWDGREHLLVWSKRRGYTVPCGLVSDVLRVLRSKKVAFELVDNTKVKFKRRSWSWGNVKLRDYQDQAIAAMLEPENFGRCIAKMPARSGKTKTAAGLMRRLGLPTLFVVPSKGLLHQTIESLNECFPGQAIGQIGDGACRVEVITVATIQSLQAMAKRKRKKKRGDEDDDRPLFKELVKSFDVLICDECHHFSGSGNWHNILKQFDVAYRFGFTATLFPKREQEREMGVIWVRALLGRIAVNVSRQRLVKRGVLLQQNVWIQRVALPKNRQSARWSHTLQRECIFANEHRNKKIAKFASAFSRRKHPVLVVSRRVEQLALIAEELERMGDDYCSLTGKEDSDTRAARLEDLERGKFGIMLSSVLSEGIDVPFLSIVINAEGGARPVATVQRQRNTTAKKGKKFSLFIDFFDEMNPYFERHSQARLEQYEADGAKIKFV
jgi:superfamily II DNA or RNA helicase